LIPRRRQPVVRNDTQNRSLSSRARGRSHGLARSENFVATA
jgi:bifunctional non-homologous end joining protein LigD